MRVARTRADDAVVLVAPARELVDPVAVAIYHQAAERKQERHVIAIAISHASAKIDDRRLLRLSHHPAEHIGDEAAAAVLLPRREFADRLDVRCGPALL